MESFPNYDKIGRKKKDAIQDSKLTKVKLFFIPYQKFNLI